MADNSAKLNGIGHVSALDREGRTIGLLTVMTKAPQPDAHGFVVRARFWNRRGQSDSFNSPPTILALDQ